MQHKAPKIEKVEQGGLSNLVDLLRFLGEFSTGAREGERFERRKSSGFGWFGEVSPPCCFLFLGWEYSETMTLFSTAPSHQTLFLIDEL